MDDLPIEDKKCAQELVFGRGIEDLLYHPVVDVLSLGVLGYVLRGRERRKISNSCHHLVIDVPWKSEKNA